jgi:hypothetical protein
MQNFHHSLQDIGEMIPWEREIFLSMLIEDLKKQQQEQQSRG